MTAPRSTRALTVMAALSGAAGVVLQAAGTHLASPFATTAGQFLLFHAPVLLALPLLVASGHLAARTGQAAGWALALGVVLFSGDLSWRAFRGDALFPMAAPTGGTLMIAGWLLLAVAALLPRRD